jgi:hypothetical protein
MNTKHKLALAAVLALALAVLVLIVAAKLDNLKSGGPYENMSKSEYYQGIPSPEAPTETPWWKALPSDPWELDKTKPEGHKQPARPHGRLTPHYSGQNGL